MLRCLVCGSSKVNLEYSKCLRCGAAAGDRDEECDVSEETKDKLLAHAGELSVFGVTLEKPDVIQKHIGVVEGIALALAIADSLNDGVLRKLVLYLGKLEIPKGEILRLRLDEPEAITSILDEEDKQS